MVQERNWSESRERSGKQKQERKLKGWQPGEMGTGTRKKEHREQERGRWGLAGKRVETTKEGGRKPGKMEVGSRREGGGTSRKGGRNQEEGGGS